MKESAWLAFDAPGLRRSIDLCILGGVNTKPIGAHREKKIFLFCRRYIPKKQQLAMR
jgi:hypothetical protein